MLRIIKGKEEIMSNISFKNAIHGENISKKFSGFELNIPDFRVPEGFATALIGENGAGKSTLLNILAGVRMDYKGSVNFFEEENSSFNGVGQNSRGNVDPFLPETESMRERIGFTAPNDYFLPEWTVKQVREASKLLFSNFDENKFDQIIVDLDIPVDKVGKKWKKVSQLSDGNRMKLEMATVLARDTDVLILDEPASPLDPLMRDKLCEIIRDYMDVKPGKRTVFFSTHNIADMENVTDYVIIMDKGRVLETGFTEDLKEKYIMVRGDAENADQLKQYLIGAHKGNHGIEGLALATDRSNVELLNAVCEVPNLTEISVSLMKQHSNIK
jgi:ABC-2 type transport system ATP-binding protein